MNRGLSYPVFLITILCLSVACSGLAEKPNQPTVKQNGSIDYHNLADDYLEFFDNTQGLEMAERVAIFERDIVSKFEAFYGYERYKEHATEDELKEKYARAINDFEAIRDEFAQRMAFFDGQLNENIKTFAAAFSDYKPAVPIYLVHSLNEFDGGTRVLGGQSYLLFGMDLIIKYHTWPNDAPFFHHELFHAYHQQYFKGCEQLWCYLWEEGLATYVSQHLNPEATYAEMLLTIPEGLVPNTQERIVDAWVNFESVMLSEDQNTYAALFGFKKDDTGLPIRRGYYLGCLVAEEVAREYELESLAKMDVEAVFPIVQNAVKVLMAQARDISKSTIVK